MLIEVPVGQRVKVTLTFRDENDALADSADAEVTVTHPDKTVDTFTVADLTHESQGVYSLLVTPNAHGRWYVHGADPALAVATDYDYVLAQ